MRNSQDAKQTESRFYHSSEFLVGGRSSSHPQTLSQSWKLGIFFASSKSKGLDTGRRNIDPLESRGHSQYIRPILQAITPLCVTLCSHTRVIGGFMNNSGPRNSKIE